MGRQRAYGVIGLWVLAAIVPGWLAAVGVFGKPPLRDGNQASGWPILAWFLGFLVQLVVFYVAVRLNALGSLWAIGASLLPWAVDWTLPAGWIGLVPCTLVVAQGVAMLAVSRRRIDLIEHGIRATGTVVRRLPTYVNTVVNNVYIRRRLLLRIECPGKAPYEVKHSMLTEIGTGPDEGDRLHLLVDPGNPRHLMIAPRKPAAADT